MIRCGSGAPLFNHLIGEREYIRRDFEAEHLGTVEIDHQRILGRLLDR